MANINELLARAAALRDETALNSISPERAGGIMYDTLLALNELWLQQGAALVISKIYASVAAMEADTAPISDLTGQPLRSGQIVVIASSDSDNGSVYRYNGTESPSWTLVGSIGNLEPVDSLDSDSTSLPLAAHQGKVLDGKISRLGQKLSAYSDGLHLGLLLNQFWSTEDGSIQDADGFIATQKIELYNKGRITLNQDNTLGYSLYYAMCYSANGGFLGYIALRNHDLLYGVSAETFRKFYPSTQYVALNIWGTSAHAALTDADVADMTVEYVLDYSADQIGRDVEKTDECFDGNVKTKEFTSALPGYIDGDGVVQISNQTLHIEKEVHKGDVISFKCYAGSSVRAYVIKNRDGIVTRLYQEEEWMTQHNYNVEVTINEIEDGGTIYINSIYPPIVLRYTHLYKELDGEYIIDDSIPIEKLKGKVYNHFNYGTITRGVVINPTDGAEISNYDYRFSSDYIPVIAGQPYTFPVYSNIYGSEGVLNIASYNKNKQFSGTITGTLNGNLLTIYATDSYIRISGEIDDDPRVPLLQKAALLMVVNSEQYPNRYYPYGEIITYGGELSEQMNQIYNPLYGKIALFNGDSICEAAADEYRGWAYRIGQRNRMLWKNYGVGGGTITNGGWGTYVISERQYEVAPDYLILEGGSNDADRCGSIIGGTFPQAFGTFNPAGYTDTFDNDNFCGAVEYMFKNLVTQYPNTKIGFIIAPKMSHFNSSTHEIFDDVNEDFTKEHNNRRAYFEYLMKLCDKWGIKYLNLWDECKLNPWLHYEYGSADSLYVDGQHLTTKGYDIISIIIEEWMKTL